MSIVPPSIEEALERAAENATYWEDACNEMVDFMGATGIIFAPAITNFRGQWMSCSTGLKATLQEYIEGGWHLNDPREAVTALMVEKGIATDADIFPDRAERHNIPFYRDFLCKHNFGVLTGVRILTPNGYFGLFIHFANDHEGMTEAQGQKAEALQKLVQATVTKADELAHERIASFAQFFNGSESEVFILDGQGTQTLRMDNQGKLVTKQALNRLWPNEVRSQMLDELIELCSSNPDLSLSTTYSFKDGDMPINVLVIQAPTNLRHFFMPFKVIAIRTECSETMAVKQSRLSDDFDLTEAEISTVELLAAGKKPALIADLLGLKPASVRQRLKAIYDKTQVGGQVELVALYNDI